ncbi:hypothetical protein B6I21_07990 [candidate division KSB1 bacterium 4572_119]|nr:MAG: hypothetical protein B6I21_07990 [candidate division KSB1 bacterium 4572_119]
MTENTMKNGNDFLSDEPIVGISPAAKRLQKVVNKIAATNSNVLIIGEPGIGKEYTANQIFHLSNQFNNSFVKIDCAELGKTTTYTDLYGEDSEGDGAIIRSIGLLEKANNGILFLDNINKLSHEFQEEFLRILRDKTVRRLGSNESKKLNMRVISSSDFDLMPEVDSGRFKKDLYYLLNTLTLVIPPLRERKQDIPEFFAFYLKKFCKEESIEEPAVSAEIFESILGYEWKGNVRELKSTVHNLLTMSPKGELSADFLPFRIKKHPLEFLDPRNIKQTTIQIETYLIKKALRKFSGHQVKAAKLLGMPEATLRFKMKKYSINKK